MKKCNYVIFICIVFLMFVFFNCYYDAGSDDGSKDSSSGSGNASSSASTTTIWWQENSGVVQFFTDDSSMLSTTGSTYWSLRSYKTASLTNDEIIVSVSKISGLSGYGYGLIFCIQDNPSGGTFVGENFYELLITTEGKYKIVKSVKDPSNPTAATVQYSMTNWASSSFLFTGKNVANKLRVLITDPDGDTLPDFTIYFNDTLVYVFEDGTTDIDGNTVPVFSKTTGAYKYGFITTLGPDEVFPGTPVDVRFAQISPAYSSGSITASILLNKSTIDDFSVFLKNSTLRK